MRRPVLLLSILVAAGCVPELDVDESVVEARRVLAIRGEPPEARPGEVVAYTALVAEPSGTVTSLTLDWSYCVESKPLAELGPVSANCVAGSDGAIAPIGEGPTASGAVPIEACRVFGPEPPLSEDGEAGRPADPDFTGGYRQPVRAGFPTDAGTDVAFFEERIFCGLAGVGSDDAIEFQRRYHRNVNPEIEAVELVREGGATEDVAIDDVPVLAPGERIELIVRWPACPIDAACGDGVCVPDETDTVCPDDCAAPAGTCPGAEAYFYFDPALREFEVRREAMRVSWTATSAGFAEARTGVDGLTDVNESRNPFVAPSTPGPLTTWVVLRDERGGVAVRAIEWTVAAP